MLHGLERSCQLYRLSRDVWHMQTNAEKLEFHCARVLLAEEGKPGLLIRSDRSVPQSGTKNVECLRLMVKIVGNIITDLLFSLGPLYYLSRVKVSRYNRWALRGVFLIGLL